MPGTVPTDLEAKVFCVHEPRAIYGNTGSIAAVIFSCAADGGPVLEFGAGLDLA